MPNSAKKIEVSCQPFSVIRGRQSSYPVEVDALAEDFGLALVRKDWPDGLSGAIGKDAQGYFVLVNRNHPELRQRFTIAHEIAHYVLHRDLIGAGIKDDWKYRSRLPEAEERAANRLATEILVPADLLGQVVSEVVGSAEGARLSPKYLDAVAGKLAVSSMTLAARLGIPT